MRGPGLLKPTAFLSFVLAFLPARAMADTMDPAIERLVLPAPGQPGSCVDSLGNFQGGAACSLDQGAFKRLIAQYGFAFAPLAMHPARTTGFGGFQASIRGHYTSIDGGAAYWKYGTQGPRDPNTGQGSIYNPNPDRWLQHYAIDVRKGLPFGFELAADIGFMPHTSILSGGIDFRWSLLEGFRTGVGGVFPDVALGGGVRTITGTSQFQLTVASFDIQISKPIPIADSSVFTPYAGYQYVKIFGDSGLIDATPATDQLGYCNYRGPNIPGTTGATAPYSGQPVCQGGSAADSNNSRVFDPVRVNRHRLLAGLVYRYEMVLLGAQYITDVVDPGEANSGSTQEALTGMPRQSIIAFQVGGIF
jgi:hypothetical protein